jgi:predicted ATP-dependent protease
MIPISNVKNLMLKKEVISAVEKGDFHIWSVDSIKDGIEVLTGKLAGERNKDGQFEPNTVFDRADKRLDQIATDMAKFNK